ncbi:hypothetical protein KEC48_00885 [Clostridium sp. C1]|uniref:LPD28 domain-containing protein n=1 Tax=Clostridium sp. C1 TaxID=1155388 RepID=UPI001BAD7EBE|nr:LPD28 domain-containing protein [Clostridium sp. C1]QUN13124.1 hypothetical protein KEC48_00885 [Clostridium sp. C1]
MSDENSFKMILQNDDKKVYIDLSKGYDHVSNSLRKLGYDSPYDVKFTHVRFKFTHQSNENLKYLAQIVDKDDYIMDLFRAYQYLKHEEGFDKCLSTSINEHQIHSISDILVKGNLYQLYNNSKNNNIPNLQKIKLEDIRFQEITIFNKPALFTPYRIDSKDLPKGLYKYECQCDDNQDGIITMIGKSIRVNFWGTILTTKKIGLHHGYRNVGEIKDVLFTDAKSISTHDFLKKYPIVNINHFR